MTDEDLSEEEKELLLKVKAYYDQVGTISGVAKELNMQAWRIPKYLKKGHRYGLFYWDMFNKTTRLLTRKEHLKAKKDKYYKVIKQESVNDLKEIHPDEATADIQSEQKTENPAKQDGNFIFSNPSFLSIDDLPLSLRAKNGLKDAGFLTLKDCQKLSPDKILLLRQIGEKTAKEIVHVLEDATKNKIYIPQERLLQLKEEENGLSEDYLIKILAVPLSEVKLSVRATNVINRIRGRSLLNLVRMSPDQIISMKNCGRATLKEITKFLSGFNLHFNMRFTHNLNNKIKEYLLHKINQEILDDLKNAYPEKYTLLIKACQKSTPQNKISRYEECYKFYKEGGTLLYVGKKLNLTRERVRQMLEKGTSLGLFKYSGHEYPYLDKDKILKDYGQLLSLDKVAKVNSVSPSYLKRILTAYKITELDLERIKESISRNKCIMDYRKMTDQLGRPPTTTDIQKSKDWNYLGRRIIKFWGSTDNFRQELNIPKVVRTFPEKTRQWQENRKRLAFVVRMQNLDQIRECLSSSPEPLSAAEIAITCNIGLTKVWRLLNLLIARAEVIRDGIASTTKYKMNLEEL